MIGTKRRSKIRGILIYDTTLHAHWFQRLLQYLVFCCVHHLETLRQHFKIKREFILTIHSKRCKVLEKTWAFLKIMFKIKYFFIYRKLSQVTNAGSYIVCFKKIWMVFYLITFTVPFPGWCLQVVGSNRANWFPGSFDAVNDIVLHAGKRNMCIGAGADCAGSCTPRILRWRGPWARPRTCY